MLEILLVAQLALTNSAPKISPAEALAILARMDSTSNWTNRFNCSDCDGPRVTIAPYHPDDGPFGRFPVYETPLGLSAYYGSSYYGGSYYASIHSYRTNIYPHRTRVSLYGRSGMYRRAGGLAAPGRMITSPAGRSRAR